jgi:hypothetical protein
MYGLCGILSYQLSLKRKILSTEFSESLKYPSVNPRLSVVTTISTQAIIINILRVKFIRSSCNYELINYCFSAPDEDSPGLLYKCISDTTGSTESS